MYFMKELCCFCLNCSDASLISLNLKSEDNATYFEKISKSLPRIASIIDSDDDNVICLKCSETIDMICNFNATSLTNINTLSTYKSILKENARKKRYKLNVKLKKYQEPNLIDIKIEPIDSFSNNDAISEDNISFDNDKSILVSIKEEVIEEVDIESAVHFLSQTDVEVKIQNADGDPLMNSEEKSYARFINQHLMSPRNKNKKYFCDVCNKTFLHPSKLNIHKRCHTGEKPWICDVCNKSFSQKSILTRHYKCIHTGERPFSCKICSSCFLTKTTLDVHVRTHTGEKPYVCQVCNRSFTQKFECVNHMRIHTRENLFTCEVCSNSFLRKSDLTTHLRIHTGEKPYFCDICNKAFKRKTHLVEHRRIHTGEKPFTCVICNETFQRKKQLVEHKNIHSGKKPFNCDFCSESFALKADLTNHKLIHSGERPFACNFCWKTYAIKALLINHMRTHTLEMSNENMMNEESVSQNTFSDCVNT